MSSGAAPSQAGLGRFALLGAITSATAILTAIVRSKVVATKVGPAGVGITAEAAQLVALSMTLATIATGPALIAWLSEAQRDKDWRRFERGIGTALALALGLSLLGAGGALIASHWLLPRDWEVSAPLAVGLCAASSVAGTLTAVITSIFVALKDATYLSIVSLATTVISVVVSVALTLKFGLLGSLISLGAGGGVSVLMTVAIYQRRFRDAAFSLSLALDKEFLQRAVAIGFTSLIAAVTTQLVYSGIRIILQQNGGVGLGEVYNGNYQAASLIGTQYYAIVISGLANYFWPRYSEARTAEELTIEVHNAARFILRLGPPVIVTAIAFRDLIIHALYSQRFEYAVSILGFQFAGDVAKAVAWAYAGPLLYRGKARAFLLTEIVGGALAVSSCWLFVRWWGPVGTGVAHLVTYSLYMLFVAVVLSRSCGAAISWPQMGMALFLTLLAGGFEMALRLAPVVRWVALPFLAAWLWRAGVVTMVSERVLRRLRKNPA